jgi:hypothetical protein
MPTIEAQYIDPLEGSSWMHNSLISTEEDEELNTGGIASGEDLAEEMDDQVVSPVSSLPAEQRRTFNYFRMPESSKTFKPTDGNNE